MVALQAELTNLRAELDRQNKHDTRQVNELKRALAWTEDAGDIIQNRLERSQLTMKNREQSWTANEARLKARKEDAIVDAAKIRERLSLTQLDHQKQLAEVQKEKRDLDKLLRERLINLETIEAKLGAKLQAKDDKIETIEKRNDVKEADLSRTQQDYSDRKSEVKQAKGTLEEENSDLREEESELKALADRLQSMKERFAAANATHVQLKHSIDRLKKDVAEENKLAKSFRSAERSFTLVRDKVNRTMTHVKDERERALLISQDLLKVNDTCASPNLFFSFVVVVVVVVVLLHMNVFAHMIKTIICHCEVRFYAIISNCR